LTNSSQKKQTTSSKTIRLQRGGGWHYSGIKSGKNPETIYGDVAAWRKSPLTNLLQSLPSISMIVTSGLIGVIFFNTSSAF
jgi:hypothetical protein